VGSSPLEVAVGDFNGDGRSDAGVANSASNNVSVLLNDGAWPALGAPSISVNDVTVTEGNTGTTSATFTVTLSAASSQTVSVHYATADGTATAASGDYQAAAGTLTFGPGVTSQTATVLVNGDRLGENNESFLLVLTNPTNAFLADMQGVGTIVDDEPHVSIDYGPVYVTEGNSGTTTAVFTVRLSTAYDAPVDVNYSTAEGDTEWWYDGWYYPPPAATSGSDFQAVSGTLAFAPGDTVKLIQIAVNGDRVPEPNEYFSVNLTGSPSAPIDSGHAVGVIVDDEPRISINSVSIAEGDSGTKAMIFTVTLSAAYDQAVTVNFATHDDTAKVSDNDYVAKSGTLTFAPGETSKTITVLIKGDRRKEADESFYVLLSDASSNALIDYAYGWGTILNDDGSKGRK
jgi:hypothetical protein